MAAAQLDSQFGSCLISRYLLAVLQVKVADYTAYWPPDWLKMTRPQVTPYFPQVGDIVSNSTPTSIDAIFGHNLSRYLYHIWA